MLSYSVWKEDYVRDLAAVTVYCSLSVFHSNSPVFEVKIDLIIVEERVCEDWDYMFKVH